MLVNLKNNGDKLDNNVGVNDFVKRQQKNTGKTYSTLTFEEIAKHASDQLQKKQYSKGYRDGVVIVKVDKSLINKFKCPYDNINDKTILHAEVSKRRPEEENYIRIKAKNGIEIKTGKVDLILYRSDVLKETNEQTTNCIWELISFHAIPEGIDELPMGPVTMMRNQLELKGGTKGQYSSKQWANSVYFWQNYAIKE